jgi:hypothetical protein
VITKLRDIMRHRQTIADLEEAVYRARRRLNSAECEPSEAAILAARKALAEAQRTLDDERMKGSK